MSVTALTLTKNSTHIAGPPHRGAAGFVPDQSPSPDPDESDCPRAGQRNALNDTGRGASVAAKRARLRRVAAQARANDGDVEDEEIDDREDIIAESEKVDVSIRDVKQLSKEHKKIRHYIMVIGQDTEAICTHMKSIERHQESIPHINGHHQERFMAELERRHARET